MPVTREGARMDLERVITQYRMIKLGKVHKGVSPEELDIEALVWKVELAAL